MNPDEPNELTPPAPDAAPTPRPARAKKKMAPAPVDQAPETIENEATEAPAAEPEAINPKTTRSRKKVAPAPVDQAPGATENEAPASSPEVAEEVTAAPPVEAAPVSEATPAETPESAVSAADASSPVEAAAQPTEKPARPDAPEQPVAFDDVVSGRFDAEADAPAALPKRVLLPQPEQPKLHKVLAQAGLGSRLEMEQLILEGRISVNNQPAHIGQRIQFGDTVKINGRPVKLRIAPPPAPCW